MNKKFKLSTDQYHVLLGFDGGNEIFVATSQYTTNTLRKDVRIGAWATPSALRGLHKRGLIVADIYWRGANVTITEAGKELINEINKGEDE